MLVRSFRVSLVSLAALALVGCATFPGPLQADVPPDITVETPAEAGGFSLAELLAAMPTVDGRVVIVAADLATARDEADAPVPDETGDALGDWLHTLSGVEAQHTVSIPWLGRLGVQHGVVDGSFVDAVGFDVRDVDTFLEISRPPVSTIIVDGAFDLDRVDAALGDRQDGVWMQPGDELAPNLENRGGADALGRPIRVAGDEQRMMLTLMHEHAEAFVDGRAGSWGALVDVANALDDEGVYAAMMYRDHAGDAVGLGLVAHEGTSRAVVVRHYADAAGAAAAADTLPGTSDGGVTVREATVVDGLLVAELDREAGRPLASLWDLMYRLSPVLG